MTASNDLIKCKCGAYLQKIAVKFELYQNKPNHVFCSQCGEYLKPNGIVWHCKKKYNKAHVNGFDICSKCINIYKENIKNLSVSNSSSIQSILTCFNNIKRCDHVNLLINMITRYNQHDDMNPDIIVTISNCFNHSILQHDINDDDFEYIYYAFGGECHMEQCNSTKRHYRKRGLNELTYDNDNEYCLMTQLFDKIHCHFVHSYDIGYRKRSIETSKYNKIRQVVNLQNLENNKFRNNLSQISTKVDNKYSFGYPFNYWEHCKISKSKTYFNKKYKHFYVVPKYVSLKTELAEKLPASYWNDFMKDAIIHQQTDICKTYVAETNHYQAGLKWKPDHPSNYGYTDGEQIKLHHLICIMIYCAADSFQREFTETYRELKENEDFESIKARHSEYHHFAKYLNEAINVFATQTFKKDIKTMYHGIDKEMVFNGMQDRIYCVLSTTSSWNVAVRFSNNAGLVLELVPSPHLKYFDCCWLSRYSNENELLFIGGFKMFNFVNITNTFNCTEYSKHIIALRIIDSMTNKRFFTMDPTIFHDKIKKHCNSVELLELKSIPTTIKKLVIQLINHELNRNKHMNKKYDNIPLYIDKLFHQICSNKKEIRIDWQSMNTNMLKFDKGGYIGYEWLSPLLCSNDYEGIKFNVFNALFPSLESVKIYDLSLIDSNFLNDILVFLDEHKESNINKLELTIKYEFGCSNIKQQCTKYTSKFQSMQFDKMFYDKRRFDGVYAMFIRKD